VAGSVKSTPVARPDAYTGIIGNTPFSVPAASGVLTNDSDPDGDSISVVAFSATSANGGTVIVTNNGGFYFLPPVGYQGSDTFTYTISDGNGGINTATATLTISNMVWYVNNAGANGNGRLPTPFNSFASVNGAGGSGDSDGTNDFIYLFTGSGSYGAGLILERGQRLIGAGAALVVSGTTIFPASSRPTLGAGGAGVICSTNNVIQGLNIGATSGKGLTGTNIGTLTISALAVSSTNGAAVDLDAGSLIVTLDSLTCASSPAEGLRLNNINGSFSVSAGSLVTNTAGVGVRVIGGSANVTFPGPIWKNSAGQIVDIQNRTGGAVTLSGNINASGSSSGIQILNCSGGTNTFSGLSKSLSTGANTAVNCANNTGTTIRDRRK
jgi:hypothetical protein